jgi:SH3-like domain-containing protein
MNRHAVVVRAHRSRYPDPVRFRRGDRVRIGRRDRDFPGWIRVTDPGGRRGWAPEALLDGIGGAEAAATEDYIATEMDVSPGERLIVRRELAGWFWVSDAEGNHGWVPADSIRLQPE